MKKPLPKVKIPAELQDRLCAEGDAFHFEELMTAQPEATQAYFRARLAARKPAAESGE
ncbi:MAG: hypothetical protein KJS97_08355 [Alphaproteobacteria bacterium]|nr:hypothetical protein [Alphaproteobacteria bacterium]